MGSSKNKKKFDWRNLLLMAFSVAFTLAILEIFLRFFLSSNQSILYKDYQSNNFIAENKYWKAWHYPGNTTIHSRDCFSSTYITNEYGMKDDSVNWQKKKVALLGDSYIEGYGKNNNQIISHFLQQKVGDDYEILNFGSSGGLGTVHQHSIYRNLARNFKPDIVIYFFLNYNDLVDNLNAINEGFINEQMEYTYPIAGFEEIKNYIQSFGTPPANEYNEGGLLVFKLANRGLRALGSTIASAINVRFDFRKGIAQVYDPKENEQMVKAWQILEKSLKDLHEMVKQDSANLIVVQLAEPFQLDANWQTVTEKKYDLELQPDYPNQKLEKLTEKLGIAYYDMYPDAKKYIEENNLKYPYVFHECDRHYNEEGHQMAAGMVYDFLIEKEYLQENK